MPSPDDIRFIIVVIPIALMVIGIWKPLYAAIGYMIFVYANATHYYPFFMPFKAELVFALVILVRIGLSYRNLKRLSYHGNAVNKYVYLFVACVALSFLYAWDYQVSWSYGVYHFLKTLVLYLMVVMTLEGRKDIKIFAWSFVLLFAYLAYEPTYGFLTGTGGDVQMYGTIYVSSVGPLSGHVALANNMNQMIPLAYFLTLGYRNIYKRAFIAIPLIIFMTALIGSGSRGGVMGFAFFGMVLVFFSKKRAVTATIIGVLLVILFLFSVNISSTASRIEKGQVWGRFTGLTHGIEMVKRGSIFGVGPGCFALARGRYFGHPMDAHNIYGQVIGELGIPGAIAWFFILRATFINLMKSKRLLRSMAMQRTFFYFLASGMQASLVVRLFVAMGSHGLYYFYWFIMPAMSAAIFFAVKRMADESPAESVPQEKAA
ncbi:MAG TPA: O-antigen ligase family protein [Deltaproteobacteria bacterium]|nr:O-antigen ligase family protein [Deltaproteobacteria bacterium]